MLTVLTLNTCWQASLLYSKTGINFLLGRLPILNKKQNESTHIPSAFALNAMKLTEIILKIQFLSPQKTHP